MSPKVRAEYDQQDQNATTQSRAHPMQLASPEECGMAKSKVFRDRAVFGRGLVYLWVGFGRLPAAQKSPFGDHLFHPRSPLVSLSSSSLQLRWNKTERFRSKMERPVVPPLPGSHREPVPPLIWARVDEVDSPQTANLEQNGTISFQNGTASRSTTPGSHPGDEVNSPQTINMEQNGTISFQNGTASSRNVSQTFKGAALTNFPLNPAPSPPIPPSVSSSSPRSRMLHEISLPSAAAKGRRAPVSMFPRPPNPD
jgi:hypothetical protein